MHFICAKDNYSLSKLGIWISVITRGSQPCPYLEMLFFPAWLSNYCSCIFSLLFPHLSFLIFDTLVLEGSPHLALEPFDELFSASCHTSVLSLLNWKLLFPLFLSSPTTTSRWLWILLNPCSRTFSFLPLSILLPHTSIKFY